jgi:hypothetical protein
MLKSGGGVDAFRRGEARVAGDEEILTDGGGWGGGSALGLVDFVFLPIIC